MDETLDRVTRQIIGSAITVHRALGPGLLESAYEACLAFELVQAGLSVEQQKPLPLVYRDVRLDCSYRLDLLVEGQVIMEVKAVDQLLPIHQAQLLSYLRLSGCSVGLLINFHVKILKNGIRRLVNEYPDARQSSAVNLIRSNPSAFSASSAVNLIRSNPSAPSAVNLIRSNPSAFSACSAVNLLPRPPQ